MHELLVEDDYLGSYSAITNLKTIDQFDFKKAPFINRNQILNLVSCKFIDERKNLIFIGSPGTGKSHISISIGV